MKLQGHRETSVRFVSTQRFHLDGVSHPLVPHGLLSLPSGAFREQRPSAAYAEASACRLPAFYVVFNVCIYQLSCSTLRKRSCNFPLLRFTWCLLYRISNDVHSQSASAPSARALLHTARLVPPSQFPTTLAAYSVHWPASLLRLASSREVQRISDFRIPPCEHSGVSPSFLRPYTPRRIPLEPAVPHHCGHSLLGVTPIASPPSEDDDSQWNSSTSVHCASTVTIRPCVSVKLRPSRN